MADPKVLFACPSCGARTVVALIATGPAQPAGGPEAAATAGPPDRLLPMRLVTRRLGLSKTLVYKLLGTNGERPELPHTRVGTRYLVSARDLEAFIAQQTVNAQSRP